LKKKSFTSPKLRRNKSKVPWAFPLAERKTNPPPPAPHHNLKGNRPRHPESMIVPSCRLDEISLHLKS